MKSSNIKKKKNYRRILFSNPLLILFFVVSSTWLNSCGLKEPNSISFFEVQNQAFVNNDSSYFIKGANYWYGGHIGFTDSGLNRLKSELDFLKKHELRNSVVR